MLVAVVMENVAQVLAGGFGSRIRRLINFVYYLGCLEKFFFLDIQPVKIKASP